MKKIILLLCLFIAGFSFAQNINDYKYIVIPEKFSSQQNKDQYNLNNLAKMMFEKYGFEVYGITDKLPQELALNGCRALYADLVKEPGFMSTNLSIILKSCQNQEVFKSKVGKSKIKDLNRAYGEALRDASYSLDALDYAFSGNDVILGSTLENKSEIVKTTKTTQNKNHENQLIASPIANGFELLDTQKRVVLKIFKTSQPDFYTAQLDTISGMFFKKGNDWYFEYYQNEKLISEKLNVKF